MYKITINVNNKHKKRVDEGMKNKIIIITSVICLAISIICLIMLINKKDDSVEENDNKTYVSELIEDDCTEEYKQEQKTTKTVSSSEEKVSANAILILKKYYKNCEHTINEYVELPQELVNMTKEEVGNQYPDWKVIGFEAGKVTLYKEFDDVCNEHFKLRAEEGMVVVYIVNRDGSESIYERTNISEEYLTETDLINMQNGLEIYGKEELNKIIEDFE